MARKSSQVSRKHVPLRTCIACRKVRASRELTRIVRLPSGGVEIDETHKKSGRGAYLCRSRACWETALGRKLLEHGLKTEIANEELSYLWQHCCSLPVESAHEASARVAP
ncbi:MAG: YlxR family protein [Anaerolineae bacterium]|jgi:predicted RNA-binding protein YlxR (DUF448 family)|nr:YlxR family protein [Anaerolineae bacterium]